MCDVKTLQLFYSSIFVKSTSTSTTTASFDQRQNEEKKEKDKNDEAVRLYVHHLADARKCHSLDCLELVRSYVENTMWITIVTQWVEATKNMPSPPSIPFSVLVEWCSPNENWFHLNIFTTLLKSLSAHGRIGSIDDTVFAQICKCLNNGGYNSKEQEPCAKLLMKLRFTEYMMKMATNIVTDPPGGVIIVEPSEMSTPTCDMSTLTIFMQAPLYRSTAESILSDHMSQLGVTHSLECLQTQLKGMSRVSWHHTVQQWSDEKVKLSDPCAKMDPSWLFATSSIQGISIITTMEVLMRLSVRPGIIHPITDEHVNHILSRCTAREREAVFVLVQKLRML